MVLILANFDSCFNKYIHFNIILKTTDSYDIFDEATCKVSCEKIQELDTELATELGKNVDKDYTDLLNKLKKYIDCCFENSLEYLNKK